jgi:hypothetical protein
MRKGWLCALALVINAAYGAPVDAQSANNLFKVCQIAGRIMGDNAEFPQSSWENHWSGVCSGYVVGIYFAGNGHGFCAPPTSNNTQAMRVVVRYMEDHPEKRDLPFGTVALEALAAIWPCRH